MKSEKNNFSLKNTEILLVEDSITQAEQIRRLLESHYYKVSMAQNGKQAMDQLSKYKPALVISDIVMPEMNGFELCRKIKFNKNTADIPVILLTRLTDTEEIIEGLSCGADSFITKPYNEDYLLSNIARFLSDENPEHQKRVPFGVQILFKGKNRFIQAEQQNIIKLMLDIYEGAIHQNERLLQTQEELRLLNEKLESLVDDRTSDLLEEIKLSNQIAERLKENEKKLERTHMKQESVTLLQQSLLQSVPLSQKLKNITDSVVRIFHADFCRIWLIQPGDLCEKGCVHAKILEGPHICRYRDLCLHLLSSSGRYTHTNGKVHRRVPFGCYKIGKIASGDEHKFITNDAQNDPRIHNLDWTRKLGLVSFAGYQLQVPGSTTLGVLALFSRHQIASSEDAMLDGLSSTIAHIVRQTQAENASDQERRLLRTLIDNIPDTIYVLDKDGRKVVANKADVENTGLSSENEVIGKTDLELFPGEIGVRGHNDNIAVLQSGNPDINREENFFDKNGIQKWLLSSKFPLHDQQGNIIGLVGIGHDITEKKNIIEELIRAKEKAEESDRLKTAFLHNISHEIRTPMNAIVGFATLLGEPDVDTQSRKDYIEVIMQSSNHLLSIISDIVDISNIEANLVKIVKNDININLVLKSLCDQYLPKAIEKKIQLICKTNVPDSDAFIVTDSIKLTQILINLINNGIKFTDNGYVKVGCVLIDRFLEFHVSDTGIGISEEYHKRIFDRFFQVQYTVSRSYEGTGLGLAISKAHVELMGGKIWVTSEPGKGSSFFFTIPYEKQAVETIAINGKTVAEGYVFPLRKTILVAEDIDSNFRLIRYFLSGTNAIIVRAVNGQEAVDKCLSDKTIDLVLMDIKMPVMDGYTATKLIRETNTTIPIIAQTAYADDKELAIESGCSGFISKPFDKRRLLTIIHEFI